MVDIWRLDFIATHGPNPTASFEGYWKGGLCGCNSEEQKNQRSTTVEGKKNPEFTAMGCVPPPPGRTKPNWEPDAGSLARSSPEKHQVMGTRDQKSSTGVL